MNGRTDRLMDYGRTNRRGIDGGTKGWTDGGEVRVMGGWMDGWMDGWIDVLTDAQINKWICGQIVRGK